MRPQELPTENELLCKLIVNKHIDDLDRQRAVTFILQLAEDHVRGMEGPLANAVRIICEEVKARKRRPPISERPLVNPKKSHQI